MGEIVTFPMDREHAIAMTQAKRPAPVDPHNLSPRAMGRLAPFKNLDLPDCPFPPFSPAWNEWVEGYSEGYGMPTDLQGKFSLMVEVAGVMGDTLTAIRAIGTPEIQALVDECRAKNRRPRGNLVPLQASL